MATLLAPPHTGGRCVAVLGSGLAPAPTDHASSESDMAASMDASASPWSATGAPVATTLPTPLPVVLAVALFLGAPLSAPRASAAWASRACRVRCEVTRSATDDAGVTLDSPCVVLSGRALVVDVLARGAGLSAGLVAGKALVAAWDAHALTPRCSLLACLAPGVARFRRRLLAVGRSALACAGGCRCCAGGAADMGAAVVPAPAAPAASSAVAAVVVARAFQELCASVLRLRLACHRRRVDMSNEAPILSCSNMRVW